LRFNNAIGKHHPNIYKLVGAILEEQASVEMLHQQIIAGRIVRRSSTKYQSIQKRLHKLQQRYNSGSLNAIEYITGVSYNLAERH
jgi:hypothetical protein